MPSITPICSSSDQMVPWSSSAQPRPRLRSGRCLGAPSVSIPLVILALAASSLCVLAGVPTATDSDGDGVGNRWVQRPFTLPPSFPASGALSTVTAQLPPPGRAGSSLRSVVLQLEQPSSGREPAMLARWGWPGRAARCVHVVAINGCCPPLSPPRFGFAHDHVCRAPTVTTGSLDNCPAVPNSDQADANSNGVGNACDTAGAFSSSWRPCG